MLQMLSMLFAILKGPLGENRRDIWISSSTIKLQAHSDRVKLELIREKWGSLRDAVIILFLMMSHWNLPSKPCSAASRQKDQVTNFNYNKAQAEMQCLVRSSKSLSIQGIFNIILIHMFLIMSLMFTSAACMCSAKTLILQNSITFCF